MPANREELISTVAHHLYKHDANHSDLVNFFDDEVDWEQIATVAIDYLSDTRLLELDDE